MNQSNVISGKSILLLNGPNLNLLGVREPILFGLETLADLEKDLMQHANQLGSSLLCYQSNHEGVLIDCIHATASQAIDAIIINPGAFTHTSIALRDALLAVAIPFVEVHVTNVHKREHFRKQSFFSDIAEAVIVGCGTVGYKMALDYVIQKL